MQEEKGEPEMEEAPLKNANIRQVANSPFAG